MVSNIVRLVVSAFFVACIIPACGDTGGNGGSGSGGGGNGPTCDDKTKGFVKCNEFVTCQPGTYCSDPGVGLCTDGCASTTNCGCNETCTGGKCTLNDVCGDGKCSGSENPTSCPADCKTTTCGNGMCDAGETPASCPMDCTTCGNGMCDAGETPLTCPLDCTTCGNGACDVGETPLTCPMDCTTCGNGTCDTGETTQNCVKDCPDLKGECKANCDAYDFFSCFVAGELQQCYNDCMAATDAQLKQFNNCADTGATGCDMTCFTFLP